MQRIFLSDLHLSDPEDKVFIGFAACLEAEAKQVDEIYILGDLVVAISVSNSVYICAFEGHTF